jgi:DNA-3-methyladenine glycosylase II
VIAPARVHHAIAAVLRSIPLPNEALNHVPPSLAEQLGHLTPLIHVGSESLEEALVKAIARQVISAAQARILARRFVESFADPYLLGDAVVYRFPCAHEIAAIAPQSLREIGFGFKANVVIEAMARLAHSDLLFRQASLSSEALLEELQQLPGIGPWTARVAVCDVRADWSVYPFDDLAVRKWAAELWPGGWPKPPRAFADSWRRINGEYVPQITFYLLTGGPVLHRATKGEDTNVSRP